MREVSSGQDRPILPFRVANRKAVFVSFARSQNQPYNKHEYCYELILNVKILRYDNNSKGLFTWRWTDEVTYSRSPHLSCKRDQVK